MTATAPTAQRRKGSGSIWDSFFQYDIEYQGKGKMGRK
jgi:hypothetical protein